MNLFKKEELWISKGNDKIFGICYTPINEDIRHPLVIISHGFGGVHEYNTDYAEYFAQNGFICYNFDFCGGAPESKSDGNLCDMSVLTEAEDLYVILGYMKKRDDVDPLNIFLLGESQGGFVSAYVAAKHNQDIKGLILFYPAFVIQNDAEARRDKNGNFPVLASIMGITVGRKYNEDAVSFDIYDVIGNFKGDVLIIHGTNDSIVPIGYSQKAAEIYSSAEFVQLRGQGHGFTGNGRREAAEKAVDFALVHVIKKG